MSSVNVNNSTILQPRKENSRIKKYRQLVSKSKIKLSHGAFTNTAFFKSKTRLQKKKLGLVKRQVRETAVGFKLMDIQMLLASLNDFSICKHCKKGGFTIEENSYCRKGLAQCLVFKCKHCNAETSTYTSKKVSSGISAFDVNICSTYGSLPFGREGLAKFCGLLDLPPPVLQDSYNNICNKLSGESKTLAENSMKNAAQNLIKYKMENDPNDIDVNLDGTVIAKVAVSVDGTWQKRGHSSKHGVVFIISSDTGGVLDFSIKTLHCSSCQMHQSDDKQSEKYKTWYEKHAPDCTINFGGSSGAMESDAGVEMWLRSIKKNNLRYKTYIGDGDSSSYGKVKDACLKAYPDGSYQVEKEECVGHIQKRMGSGLREYKKRKRGQKLADGRGVGGTNRLTESFMDRIQHNYGEAIRSCSSVNEMKTAIQAVFHHMIKNDCLPLSKQHQYCPVHKNTWCKYWLDKLHDSDKYTEDSRLPSVFKDELRPIFDRLSDSTLLSRCLKGLTQNQNESINNMLWALCTKRKFCSYNRLLLYVYETITKFNSGVSMKSVVLKNVGCEPTHHMVNVLRKEDNQRIDHAERKISIKRRSARQKQRLDRKRKMDNKPVGYVSGGFGLMSVPESSNQPIEITFVEENLAKSQKNGFLVFN